MHFNCKNAGCHSCKKLFSILDLCVTIKAVNICSKALKICHFLDHFLTKVLEIDKIRYYNRPFLKTFAVILLIVNLRNDMTISINQDSQEKKLPHDSCQSSLSLLYTQNI